MGKGSRVRESRSLETQDNAVSAKLSKKQLIRLQQKKAKTKKLITTIATVSLLVILAVVIVISSIPKVPNLEKDVAAEGAGYQIDNAMFAYLLYDNLYQNSSYLSYYGYDTSKTLKNQTSSCAFDTSKTWYEYFCTMTINLFDQYIALAAAAKADGMELSEEDIAEIDEQFEELEKNSYKKGYGSIDKYFAAAYTPGVTAKAVRRVVELEMLASNYYNKFIEDAKSKYTDEDLDEYRELNPGKFLKLDYVYYTFSPSYEKGATADEKTAAYEAAKKLAEEFKAANTTLEAFKDAIVNLEFEDEDDKDEKAVDTEGPTLEEKQEILDDFIKEGTLYDETKAEADATKAYYEWAYSSDRAAGDTYIEETKASNGDLSYTVYMIEKPVYIDDYTSKDVRHILVAVNSSLTGAKLEKAFEQAKEEAQKILDEYNKGEKTAEAFGALAKKHTDDSNGDKGGLYENVSKGTMVAEFENWIYDEARKVGDVDLVKTSYGWHIMYFVGDGMTAWKITAEAGLAEEDYADHLEDLKEQYPVEYDYKTIFKIS